MIDRTDRVLRAVCRRIGDQGDMHIRISWHTFRVIRLALDSEKFGDWEDQDDFREVDAPALEILVATAMARRAEQANAPKRYRCTTCFDTGYVDFAHLALEPCDHLQPAGTDDLGPARPTIGAS